MCIIGTIVLVRTGLAIWQHVQRNLIIAIFCGFTLTATAVETPYPALVPEDVTDPLGTWGYDSTLLGELHLLREIQETNLKFTVMLYGAFLAFMAIRLINRP